MVERREILTILLMTRDEKLTRRCGVGPGVGSVGNDLCCGWLPKM
ncbi:hypothetical protein [Ancylothrix sp. D3o]|nr:hypothetical protein [Ancylothrix sp. D3o]